MRITKNTLTIIASLALSTVLLSAKSTDPNTREIINPNVLTINIIQQNQEQISGRLINADAAYLVFENLTDEAVQLIPRSEVQLVETNLNIDLFEILNSQDPEQLTDIIELNDGTKISAIILDIGLDNVQYFTGTSLKRHVVSTSDIYALRLDQNSVEIPFPVFAANEATL